MGRDEPSRLRMRPPSGQLTFKPAQKSDDLMLAAVVAMGLRETAPRVLARRAV